MLRNVDCSKKSTLTKYILNIYSDITTVWSSGGRKLEEYYTQSHAEAEFEGLTAGFETIQLRP